MSEIYNPGQGFAVTSEWNPSRVLRGVRAPHRGRDYGASTGTPIPAAGDGKVVYKNFLGAYGNVVVLEHLYGNDEIVHTLYAHMHSLSPLAIGTHVRKNQAIGPVGNTGRSYGAHVHFEILRNGRRGSPNLVRGHATVDPRGFDVSGLRDPDGASASTPAPAPTNTQTPPTTTPTPAPTAPISNGDYKFPVSKADGTQYSAQELFGLLSEENSGHYLLSSHQFWHGGIHFTDKKFPHCVKESPIQAMSKGEVVAYRLNKEYEKVGDASSEGDEYRYSTGFCLIKHRYESPKVALTPQEKMNKWQGKQIILQVNRNARNIADTARRADTNDYVTKLPKDTVLDVVEIGTEEKKGYYFIKVTTNVDFQGTTKAGTSQAIPTGSELYIAAFKPDGNIAKDDGKDVFKDNNATAEDANKEENTKQYSFDYYSLYMHLCSYNDYLPAQQETAEEKKEIVTIKADKLRVRDKERTDPTFAIIGFISNGATVEVLQRMQTGNITDIKGIIITGNVMHAGATVKRAGDEVWLAIKDGNKSFIAEPQVPKERSKPSYWQGMVTAKVKNANGLAIFRSLENNVLTGTAGTITQSNSFTFESTQAKEITQEGKTRLVAECKPKGTLAFRAEGTQLESFWTTVDTESSIIREKIEPTVFDEIVSCSTKVTAGEVLGYLGLYETPTAKGEKDTKRQAHVEIFIPEKKGVDYLLNNPLGLKEGRQFIRLPKGTKLTRRPFIPAPANSPVPASSPAPVTPQTPSGAAGGGIAGGRVGNPTGGIGIGGTSTPPIRREPPFMPVSIGDFAGMGRANNLVGTQTSGIDGSIGDYVTGIAGGTMNNPHGTVLSDMDVSIGDYVTGIAGGTMNNPHGTGLFDKGASIGDYVTGIAGGTMNNPHGTVLSDMGVLIGDYVTGIAGGTMNNPSAGQAGISIGDILGTTSGTSSTIPSGAMGFVGGAAGTPLGTDTGAIIGAGTQTTTGGGVAGGQTTPTAEQDFSDYTLEYDHVFAIDTLKLEKDAAGKEWYFIATEQQSGRVEKTATAPEIANQYEWAKLGFKTIEEKDTNADGFLDPDLMPDFFKQIYNKIDTDGKDGVSQQELKAALKDPDLGEIWSKFIALHPTEWRANKESIKARFEEILKNPELSEEQAAKGEKLFNQEVARMDKLTFWDKLPVTPSLPQMVYHFHPIAFIEGVKTVKVMAKASSECACRICGKSLALERDFLKAIAPQATESFIDAFVELSGTLFPKYEINTCSQLLHLLAQSKKECTEFTKFRESLHYTRRSYPDPVRFFDSRHSVLNDGFTRLGLGHFTRQQRIDHVAQNLMSNDPAYARHCFGSNEFPNNDYRGRGIIQLSHFPTYQDFAKDSGYPVDARPELVESDDKVIIESAFWYWFNKAGKKRARDRVSIKHVLSVLANDTSVSEDDTVKEITRIVNGGATGLDDRKRYKREITAEFERRYGKCSPSAEASPEVITNQGLGVNPPWLDIAWREHAKYRGVREHEEPLATAIRQYHNSTVSRGAGPRVPWCASFVNWCVRESGYRNSNAATSRAYSWKPDRWPEGVTHKPEENNGKGKPFVGAIVVFNFSHVAFVLGKTQQGRLVVLGGNQGSYYINVTNVGASTVLCYTRPRDFQVSAELENLPTLIVRGGEMTHANTR